MRVAVLALLWTLASCDQIFGIERTQPWDAQLPIDAPNWPTAITWETFDHGVVTNDPIDGLTVSVGVLDLGSDVTSIPTPMPLAVDGSGTFQVPYALAFAPYRVVFTAPDGLPTEIQTGLHGFAWGFPIYGPHDRSSVAPGATFSGTAAGASGSPLRLLTTGLWSVTEGGASGGSGAFTFAYGSGVSLSGPLGVPSGSDDVAIVLFGTGSGTGATASGFAVFPGGIGNAGSASYQMPSTTTVSWTTNNAAQAQRISDQLAGYGSAVPMHSAWAGAIPSTAMPSFVQPQGAGSGSGVAAAASALAPPVMLPLDEHGASSGATFVNPFDGGAAGSATLAMYEAEIAYRAGSAVAPLTSPTYLPAGLQTIARFDGTNNASPPLGAGVAASNDSSPNSPMTFGGVPLDRDGVTISRGSLAAMQLVFGADRTVDDCVVTVYVVVDDPDHVAATLTPRARYIAMDAPAPPNQPLMIATSLFDPSSVYTFGVHCELGHDLSGNDYRLATYPFSASTTFSALFTVQ